LVYRQASHILLNTREISNFIQRTFKVLPENITINSNWIDTNQFKLMKKNNGELNRVLFVGRFSREKNISLLFAALENTGIGIDLVGDGEQKLELIDIAKENNIDANFLGKFPNNSMPEIYNRYPVYILCSQYEGNPKTLLEAMACGSAVIGTNVSGIRDIISNDVNGLLVSEDSSDISNAIKKLLADESLRCKLGANARKAIMDNNSIEHYLNKEYDLYRRLLN